MPLDMNEVRDVFRGELKTALETQEKKSDDLHEMVKAMEAKGGADISDITGRIKDQHEDMKKLSAEIAAHEKKMSRAFAVNERKSAGQQFIESDEFKSTDWSSPNKVKLDVKDILNSGNIATGVSRSVLVPEQDGGFIAPPEQALMIRSLIPSGPTASNSIRSIKETGYTNNAAPVAEGGTKPQSEITFSEVTEPVQKIAHKLRPSMEILDDAPMLRSYIDIRGRYGLNLKEEGQLLTGNGTSPNLNGLLPQATAYDNTTITGYTPATLIDDIRVAKLQVRKALYPASGIVMNPEDWAAIELTKDTAGWYIVTNPQGVAQPMLWGLPVIQSDSMTPGDFLVGAFSLGAQIWDRMGMTVMASTEDGDNFSENMVTILFEKRLALEVTRPEAFVFYDASA